MIKLTESTDKPHPAELILSLPTPNTGAALE